MANQDQQPPWGKNNRPQSPEEILAQIIKKLQDFFREKPQTPRQTGSSEPPFQPADMFSNIWKIFSFIGLFILLQGAYGSFYKIDPGEVGVILRLGKYDTITQPGLHLKIPYIDTVTKVNVEKIRKQEFGFRSKSPGQQSSFDRHGFDMESLSLTADKNVINVAWIVQYKVRDPYIFLYKIKDVEQAIHDAAESVTRRIIGNMDFDYVLSNRDLLAAAVKKELQLELDNLQTGVALVTVQFQDINPPDPVKPAFNEVNEADQDMKRLVNEAEENYNRVIPKARGDAKKIIEESYGYAAERTNTAKGQAERFLDILKEYKIAPEVTKKRMYLETMQEIMPTLQNIYVIDKNQTSPFPFMNITGKAETPAQPAK